MFESAKIYDMNSEQTSCVDTSYTKPNPQVLILLYQKGSKQLECSYHHVPGWADIGKK